MSQSCPMPYAWIVASCSMGYLLSDCSLDLAFPLALVVFSGSPWLIACLEAYGLPLYLGFPPLNSGIACLAW